MHACEERTLTWPDLHPLLSTMVADGGHLSSHPSSAIVVIAGSHHLSSIIVIVVSCGLKNCLVSELAVQL
jgi:hypothetical protein